MYANGQKSAPPVHNHPHDGERESKPPENAVPRNPHCRVLIVSRDEMLLRTREMIFGAYFQVSAVGRVTEAVAKLTSNYFDLVVLCHSLRESECERIADLAHKHAHPARILALKPITDFGDERPWADDEVGVDAGPYGLLLKAAQMLDFRIMSRAKPRAGELLGSAVREPFPPQMSDAPNFSRRVQRKRF